MNADSVKYDELLFVENHNSWHRIAMLFRLYWPVLRKGVITYPLAIVLLYAAVALLQVATGGWHEVLVEVALTVMIVWAPVMITRYDYRSVCAQLPVTAGDKLAFLMIVFWLIFPALVMVPQLLCGWVMDTVFSIDTTAGLLSGDEPIGNYVLIGVLTLYSLITIGMYYAVTAKSNRAWACMLSVFVYYIGYMVLSGIVMFSIGFYDGFMSAVGNENTTYSLSDIESWSLMFTTAVSIIYILVAGIYLVNLHKRLRNSGF